METGRDVLRAIDKELRTMRGSVATQTEALGRSSRYLADVRQEQAHALRDLAKIRLDQIKEQAVAGEVQASELHVRGLLAEHDELLRQALDAIQTGERAIETLERERETEGEALQAAEKALDEAVAATHQRLERDPAYTKQADGVREAQEIAANAARKVELALQDRIEKGAPYEADPLFMYLWQRKYGTAEYSAMPLIRTLDGWVAGLCKYDGARRNYKVLTDIPVRLEEHAQNQARLAERAEADLERVEQEAFRADGHDPVRVAAERARERVEQLDASLKEAEAEHLAAVQAHRELASGSDPTFRKALEAVVQMLRSKDLSELREEVERTPLPEDDLIVAKLMELEQEESFLQARVSEENEAVYGAKRLLGDLEWVRQKFKAARFDSDYSTFGDSRFIEGLVGQLSRQSLSREAFWTSLAQRQRSSGQRGAFGGFGGFSGVGGVAWDLTRMATRSLGRRPRRMSFPTAHRRSRSASRIGGGSFGGRGGFRTGGRF